MNSLQTVATVLATLSTIIIAAFTAALFKLQSRQHRHEKAVRQAHYKLALFDKRMEVYFALEEMLRGFLKAGHPPFEDVRKLMHETRNADFLFSGELLTFLQEIIDKSLEYHRLSKSWEHLDNKSAATADMTEEEKLEHKKAQDKMGEIAIWFARIVDNDRLKQELGPYLKLPEAV